MTSKHVPSTKVNIPYSLISQLNKPPRIIKYVLNPEEYRLLKNVNDAEVDLRQAELYCMTCSTRASLTKDNIHTFPVNFATCPIEEHVFEYSTSYGGKCLMKPGCM